MRRPAEVLIPSVFAVLILGAVRPWCAFPEPASEVVSVSTGVVCRAAVLCSPIPAESDAGCGYLGRSPFLCFPLINLET